MKRLTKSQYELIAQAINGTRYSHDGLDGLARQLAYAFEKEDNQFKRTNFLALAGVPEAQGKYEAK